MTQAVPLSWPVDSVAPAETPASVSAACRFVGHDLLASGTIRNALSATAWWLEIDEQLPPGFMVLGLAAGADRLFGFGLDPARPVAEVVAGGRRPGAATPERVRVPAVAELRRWAARPAPDDRGRCSYLELCRPPTQRIRIGEWSAED